MTKTVELSSQGLVISLTNCSVNFWRPRSVFCSANSLLKIEVETNPEVSTFPGNDIPQISARTKVFSTIIYKYVF